MAKYLHFLILYDYNRHHLQYGFYWLNQKGLLIYLNFLDFSVLSDFQRHYLMIWIVLHIIYLIIPILTNSDYKNGAVPVFFQMSLSFKIRSDFFINR